MSETNPDIHWKPISAGIPGVLEHVESASWASLALLACLALWLSGISGGSAVELVGWEFSQRPGLTGVC